MLGDFSKGRQPGNNQTWLDLGTLIPNHKPGSLCSLPLTPPSLHTIARNSQATLSCHSLLKRLQGPHFLPEKCRTLRLGLLLFFFFFCLFSISWAAPAAYGGSQARGRAVAAGLCQSHSNAATELHLRPTPQVTAMPDP